MAEHCPNCGKENDDESKFCRNCGKRLYGRHNINTENNTATDNKEKILLGVVIVLVIAIAVVGAFAFISLNNNNEDTGLTNNNNLNSTSDDVSAVSSSNIPLSEVYGLATALSNNPSGSSIQYKGVIFTKQQCLYIFAKAIDMKNKGLNGNINFKSFGPPDDPLYGMSTYYLTKSEYVDMAQRTAAWMDNNGNAPNYTGIVVAGNPDFGYEELVKAFARVILSSENDSLPPSISI